MIQTIAFYLFAALVIASAVMVIMSRNPVHSVLWLILAFFNAAGLMVLVGAEFIAALMVIVYVGAVAVLFLFVVMMLDIDFAELRAGFIKNFPLGIAIALVLAAELIFGIGAYQAGRIDLGVASGAAAPILGESNTASIGAVLRGELPAQPFVERVLVDLALREPLAALGLGMALLAGFLMIAHALPAAKSTRHALAGSLFGFSLAAFVSNYPSVLIGYGAAPILGYGLALALARHTRQD